MNITTSGGMDIYCLPDNAVRKITGENPQKMSKCPILNFDDYGDICVPEMCEEYEESEV